MNRLIAPLVFAIGMFDVALASADGPHADVQKVLDAYRAAVPALEDLTVYSLDWSPTFDEAKNRAANEQRPILLIVVTNSYGNLYSGHC
jgi:hypothetical protein